MNTQYTPGPWHPALKDTVKDAHWAHIENGQRLIAFAYGHDDQSKANARLIAAAPELLEACESAVAWHVAQDGTEKAWTTSRLAVFEALKRAIAKATTPKKGVKA